MAAQQSLCRHPFTDETTWYEVPCGIPIDNPEPEDENDMPYSWAGDIEDVLNRPVYVGPMMMRAWCPICRTWKEPLLSIDGAHYFGDELS